MDDLQPVDLRKFKKKALANKGRMRRFLTKLEAKPPRMLDKTIGIVEAEVWLETDCLSCANCCKTMTPTFTPADLKRISSHFGQTVDQFQKQWLKRERGGERDWLNKTEPCQFLNLADNKCSIYEIRPADCAGFPHLRRRFKDYVHIHKQNVEYCPATYRLVEKMMTNVSM
jgi:Fe-S-cluster containining protein